MNIASWHRFSARTGDRTLDRLREKLRQPLRPEDISLTRGERTATWQNRTPARHRSGWCMSLAAVPLCIYR